MLIKFCGLTRQEDVDHAASLGAAMCGFIFHPRSPRGVTVAQAAALDSGAMLRVGVFVNQGADEIRRIMDEARLDYAQLHGHQSVECARAIGAERVIRVLWPDRYTHRALLYNDLQRNAEACAYYLLDAGLKGGGSGHKLDWSDLASLRPAHPWLLAGGLSAANVAMAVGMCAPAGVDFNSGVEDTPGCKNREKMAAAFMAANSKGNGYSL